MADIEINSFLCKFHHLWNSGWDANFNLESQAGNAWISLCLYLGKPSSSFHCKRPSPSRFRRTMKRTAAAKDMATAQVDPVEIVEIIGATVITSKNAIEEASKIAALRIWNYLMLKSPLKIMWK